jgi:hypothetical protein
MTNMVKAISFGICSPICYSQKLFQRGFLLTMNADGLSIASIASLECSHYALAKYEVCRWAVQQ